MASTTAFVPATLPAEFVASGATSSPFTGLTITSTEPVTSTQIIETVLSIDFASDPTLIDPGKISDTTGGGFASSATVFSEVNTIATTSGNTILGRLQFTAPTLKNGQSIEDKLMIVTATSLTPGGAIDSNVATLSVPVDVVTAPAISGSVASQPDGGASIDPFATMVIADQDFKNTATDTATITVTDPAGTATDADGLLTGVGLSKTGVGTYSIPNPVVPGTLTTVLQNLKFTPIAGTTDITTAFEVDATDTKAALTSKDTLTSVLTPGKGMVMGGPPPPPDGKLLVIDTTTGATLKTLPPATPAETPYPGPVVGPTSQYINVNADNLNITATTPNWFLHSGAGEDAISVSQANGINVLDGGTGSNFLSGGLGGTSASKDTFFVDARNAPSDTWSTVVNFHSGDDATMFGISPAAFNVAMVDNDGAAGFQGLTFHATAAGKPEASLTLTGFTQADLSGKISMAFGSEPDGTTFLKIHGT